MKNYVMIILLALHLIGSSVYARSAVQQNHNYADSAKCSLHEHTDTHEHDHFHNGNTHNHKHSHSQIVINYADFYTFSQNRDLFADLSLKESYYEINSWISNPILERFFRPPRT